jgi:cytochrome P450
MPQQHPRTFSALLAYHRDFSPESDVGISFWVMSYILRHNDEKGMSLDEIGENANVLIVAGSETTCNSS